MSNETERAKLNKKMLAAVKNFIKVNTDGTVVITKPIGTFKKGQTLPMVGVKGATLISTDPKSNFSWQKANTKTIKSLFTSLSNKKSKAPLKTVKPKKGNAR
jgi:hypothetical protein